MSEQVWAAYVDTLGSADAIRYGLLPAPVAGPDDVLVDVLATTVNWVDTFVRSGLFRTLVQFPFVVGRDVVGTVHASAHGFTAGEPVWCNSLGHGGRQGAAAGRVAVPADRLYRLPDRVDPVEAVTAVHPAGTAYLGLFTHGRLRAGETVLVCGAAGNVGSALVEFAVDAGARVIATASARDLEYCRSRGAAITLDYAAPDLTERIDAAAPSGVDVYLDTSGTNDLTVAVRLLAQRGRIVLLAGARTRPVLPAGKLYMKDGSVVGFVISHATVAELAETAREVNRMLAEGRLRPRSVERLPLAAMAEAHGRLERGTLHARRLALHPPPRPPHPASSPTLP